MKSAYQGSWTGLSNDAQQFIADHYDYIITTHDSATITAMKNRGSNATFLYYLNGVGVHTTSEIWDDVVAADLFWRNTSDQLVQNTVYGWYVVDIRDSQWASIINSHLATKGYYDGVMLDGYHILNTAVLTSLPAEYTHAAHYAALQSTATDIKTAYPGSLITFNGVRTDKTPPYWGVEIATDILDGAVFEIFAFDWDGDLRSFQSIVDTAQSMKTIKAAGKMVSSGDFGHSYSWERLFSLGLMLWAGCDDDDVYSHRDVNLAVGPKWYPEYELDFGSPTSDTYLFNTLYCRTYGKHIVGVNPASSTIRIALPMNCCQLHIDGGGAWDGDLGSYNWCPDIQTQHRHIIGVNCTMVVPAWTSAIVQVRSGAAAPPTAHGQGAFGPEGDIITEPPQVSGIATSTLRASGAPEITAVVIDAIGCTEYTDIAGTITTDAPTIAGAAVKSNDATGTIALEAIEVSALCDGWSAGEIIIAPTIVSGECQIGWMTPGTITLHEATVSGEIVLHGYKAIGAITTEAIDVWGTLMPVAEIVLPEVTVSGVCTLAHDAQSGLTGMRFSPATVAATATIA